MKIITLITVVLLLTGCGVQEASQKRIWRGAEECRSKGGYILPDRARSGTFYRCIGPEGVIDISVDMHSGFGSIKYK